jgi:hypothetical protein
LLSVILIAGTLSAVVSMATIKWIYPKRAGERTVTTHPAAPADAPKPDTKAEPQPAPTPSATKTGSGTVAEARATTPEEKLALDFFRKAAAGDLEGAAAMTDGLTTAILADQIQRHAPVPGRVAQLPGAPGITTVLIATANGPMGMHSQYQVTIRQNRVHGLKGPMAPEGGFSPLALTLLDEEARPLDMAPHKGRALLLIAPRAPEPGLAELLTDLQQTYAPQGIDVALVLDMNSPDWLAAAREGGYAGPVWRVKARLNDVPLVSRGTLLGAYGVLIDRDGYAVASLASLEPLLYDLPDQTPAAIAPVVFRAYGLLP